MKRIIVGFFVVFLCGTSAFAKHLHPEKYYQHIRCSEFGGIEEYVLPDDTRVDCLTDEYAIEFDFGEKWAESIGQSLYYAQQTNRKPGVVLILENPKKDVKYAKRLAKVATTYNITVWLMYP